MIKAKDIMVKKLITVSKDQPVVSAEKKMVKNSISCVVVTRSKKPIGILTERDIFRDVLVANLDHKKVAIKDVMNKDVPVITGNMDVFDLVKFMKEGFLRRVPVVNNKGELIGIITQTDVVNAVLGLDKELNKKQRTDKAIGDVKRKELYKDLQDMKNIRRRADTGSKELNLLLAGGYPLSSSTLICGEPGSGKTVIAYSFLYNGLLQNECGIYVYSNELVDDIKDGFKSLGYNIDKYEKRKKLFFENVCTKQSENEGLNSCDGFKDLYSIKEFISKVKNSTRGKIRLVVNVVSQTYMFWKPDTVYRFLFELKQYLIENNITALFLVDKGVQEDKDLKSLEQLMDGVIILKTKEEGTIINNYLLVKKMECGKIIPQKYFRFIPTQGKGFVLKGVS